jgi:hypothetical protein
MPEEQKKEPFVPKEDRPEVKITMDTPLSELRVRDLSSIVGTGAQKNPFEVGKTPLKDFFDKEFPEVAKNDLKDIKSDKFEKDELKETKHDKLEKFEKNEKREIKEKERIKEIKAEKVEIDAVAVDPGRIPKPDPDPRFEQLIEAVAGLTKQVSQLSNQVEEMKKKG